MTDSRGPSRTAAFRGALWITLIALIATGVALTLQYVQTVTLVETRQRALVDDEATSLVERYRSGGILGVAGAIQREQQLPRMNEFFYLLASPDGAPIAGTLVAWPSDVTEAGYHVFKTQVQSTGTAPRERQVEARAVLLDDGYRLLVGSLSDDLAALRQRFISSLFWSFAATGALGLLLGFWYSQRGLSFLAAAAETGQRFLAGSLGERLPVSGIGDEYDRLAKTINESFAEVERLVSSLRATTDGLAHDLKTPLTRIKARLELADIEQPSREEMQEILQASRQDLDSLLQLIEDLLSLARAEEIGTGSFARVDLDRLVAEAVELYQPVAEDRGLEMSAAIQPVTMNGARSLVAQAVTNLLDNAIKFTPADGTIRIELSCTTERALLSIQDSGPGIPDDLKERALMRFGRLDDARATPGHGIGLSIVSAAARTHGADLRIFNSHPGLTVELAFPLASHVSETASLPES